MKQERIGEHILNKAYKMNLEERTSQFCQNTLESHFIKVEMFKWSTLQYKSCFKITYGLMINFLFMLPGVKWHLVKGVAYESAGTRVAVSLSPWVWSVNMNVVVVKPVWAHYGLHCDPCIPVILHLLHRFKFNRSCNIMLIL